MVMTRAEEIEKRLAEIDTEIAEIGLPLARVHASRLLDSLNQKQAKLSRMQLVQERRKLEREHARLLKGTEGGSDAKGT